jgi:dipeptidyl aminopeptidase/acylaminoacyl peptidase
MYYALRRLEKEVVWVNYMRGGHGGGWASNEEDYRDQWRRIIDWYRTHFEERPEREPVADGASAGGGLSP